jgi:hypothetical protein
MADQFQTMPIDAYRIRFAVDFAQAPRAGQHALVVNGVIVGLDTSQRYGDLVPFVPELPPKPGPQLKLPPPEVVQVNHLAKQAKPAPDYRAPVFDSRDVARIIRKSPTPITSRDISDALGIARGDGKPRVKVTDYVNSLIAKGEVIVTSNRKTIRWFAMASNINSTQEPGGDGETSPKSNSSSE